MERPKEGKFTYAKDCRTWLRRPERAEAALGHSLIGVPEIVARQAEVIPAERRLVLYHYRIDGPEISQAA